MISTLKNKAFESAKEIVIAKLSTSSSTSSNKKVGEDIGEMFEAIYNKLSAILSTEEPTK